MKARPFTEAETERIRAFADKPDRAYGDLSTLAKAMHRNPATIRNKIVRMQKDAPRPTHNLKGVMIDDWGQSHATIIGEMREGIR